MGEIHLARGRWRLARSDPKGALEPLRKLCEMRPGTVEGKVLLARAHEKLGDAPSAAMARHNAWNDYAASPGYQRRRDRLWGWRAKPSRPLTFAAIVLIGALVFSRWIAPSFHHSVQDSELPTSQWDP
jgi:hypothetical protein